MNPRHSFDPLRRDLLRRGLSLTYVERVIAELDDHREDLIAEKFGKEADMQRAEKLAVSRLGDSEQLTEAFVAQYHARTFAGRHPVWAYIVAPLPFTLILWATFYVFMFSVFSAFIHVFGKVPSVEQFGMQAFYVLSQFAPAVGAAWLVARSVRRSGRPTFWFIPACGLIALVAGAHHSHIRMPVEPGTGQFQVGLGTDLQTAQIATILVVGAFLYWRLVRGPRPIAPTNALASSEPIRHAA